MQSPQKSGLPLAANKVFWCEGRPGGSVMANDRGDHGFDAMPGQAELFQGFGCFPARFFANSALTNLKFSTKQTPSANAFSPVEIAALRSLNEKRLALGRSGVRCLSNFAALTASTSMCHLQAPAAYDKRYCVGERHFQLSSRSWSHAFSMRPVG